MDDLAAKEAAWAEEFGLIPDPHERLAAIVARTRKRHVLTPEEKLATPRVPGCVSAVWLIGSCEEGKCVFRCDAESAMVKGLVALLCDFFDGADREAIAQYECRLIEALHLEKILTPTRRNGLEAVQQWIRAFARSAS